MMRKFSFKQDVSPVRFDRSDLDEDGELLEGSHSVLNPDNVGVESLIVGQLSTDTKRSGRDPLDTFFRRERRKNNKKRHHQSLPA